MPVPLPLQCRSVLSMFAYYFPVMCYVVCMSKNNVLRLSRLGLGDLTFHKIKVKFAVLPTLIPQSVSRLLSTRSNVYVGASVEVVTREPLAAGLLFATAATP